MQGLNNKLIYNDHLRIMALTEAVSANSCLSCSALQQDPLCLVGKLYCTCNASAHCVFYCTEYSLFMLNNVGQEEAILLVSDAEWIKWTNSNQSLGNCVDAEEAARAVDAARIFVVQSLYI